MRFFNALVQSLTFSYVRKTLLFHQLEVVFNIFTCFAIIHIIVIFSKDILFLV